MPGLGPAGSLALEVPNQFTEGELAMKVLGFFTLLMFTGLAVASNKGGFVDRAAVGVLGGVMLVGGWFAIRGIEKAWNYLSKPPSDFPLNSEADGVTQLMKSAASGDLASVAGLIGQGEVIDACDSQGATALMFAAENGQFTVVDLLLSSGANKELQSSSGFTATQYANAYESERHSKTVKLLKKWKQAAK